MHHRLVTLAAALLLATSLAAPAGSLIEAQASATYLDAANQVRTTTSNMVVTVVQQVYGVAVTPSGLPGDPGQTRTGLPGSSVDLAVTVKNTGNGTDTFSLTAENTAGDITPTFTIVGDANCNGRRDAGEPVVSSLTLAADAGACVVVSAAIPASAAGGDEAEVHVSVSHDATTSATAVARVVVSDAAVLSSFLLATPAGSVTSGQTIDLVLSGGNIGAFDAFAATDPLGLGIDGILVAATVPAGLELVTADFSGGAGAGQLYYFDGSAWSTTPGSDVEQVALLLQGTGGFLVQGSAYELRYTLAVPGDASAPTQAGDPLAGDTYQSSGRVVYATTAGGANETASSNTVQHTVAAAYHVRAGPFGLVTGDYAYDGHTISRAADSQTIALAHAGNRVSFRNTIRNAGNAPDSFALSLTGMPAGWTCGTYAADGATPASTVGPVAPLATAEVVVRCNVPADGVTATATTITLTSTSVSRPAATDATTDTVGAVESGFSVGGSVSPSSASGEAGGTVTFDLNIVNGPYNPDSFALSTVVNEFGPGSTVTFYAGCGADMGGAPISNTGILAAGEATCVTAVVTIPAGANSAAEAGGRDVTFRAESASDATVGQEVTAEVLVDHRSGVSFGPNRAATVTSPGVIDLAHVLRNTGNTTATASVPAVAGTCTGCTVQFSVNGGAFADTVAGLALAPGQSADVAVRLTVPSGEPIGRRLNVVATATLDYGALGTTSATVTDTVDVIGGELRLSLGGVTCADAACTTELDATAAEAEPGDYLVYTITGDNLGTAPLRQVVITDPLPPFTTFVSVEAEATFAGTALFSTDGATWSATPIATLQTGESVYVAFDRDGDGDIDSSDTIPVAGRVTVRLVTQVD
jgi:uncharacterized repeat protein (TIGR01451 family)